MGVWDIPCPAGVGSLPTPREQGWVLGAIVKLNYRAGDHPLQGCVSTSPPTMRRRHPSISIGRGRAGPSNPK